MHFYLFTYLLEYYALLDWVLVYIVYTRKYAYNFCIDLCVFGLFSDRVYFCGLFIEK